MRPLSVTIISWLLIATATLQWLALLLYFNDPEVREIMASAKIPLFVQFTLQVANVLVYYASGIGMLNGMNWARFLYVGWFGICILLGLAIGSSILLLLPSIIIFAIVTYFLFHPDSSDYFTMM